MIPGTRKSSEARRLACAGVVCLLLATASCSVEPGAGGQPEESRPPAAIRAKVDRAAANPGDVITFTLETDYVTGVELELPEFSDIFSDFRIVNSGLSQPVQKGDRLHEERWYKLQADLAGSYVIDPVEVAYTLPDGARETLKTPKLFVEIESLLAEGDEAGDIRDIKPSVEFPRPYWRILAVAAALVGAVLAAILGKKLFDRWRRRVRERRLAPRPSHEEALEALERLLAKGLVEKGLAREFCFEISEIFRRYMHASTDVPAIDMTTEEIIPRIEDNGIVREDLKPLVREFLASTDLVKFAKYRPTGREIDEIIEGARKFISETTPASTVETEAANGGDAP